VAGPTWQNSQIDPFSSVAGKYRLEILLFLCLTPAGFGQAGIRPCPKQPFYWCFENKPVLLLGSKARAAIRAVRKLESIAPFWELHPRMDLLENREPNEAFLAVHPDSVYVVYFTNGGTVDLHCPPGSYRLRWICGDDGNWGFTRELSADSRIRIETPGSGNWFAILEKLGGKRPESTDPGQ